MELFDRVLNGKDSAWRELVSEYSGLLLGVSRKTFMSYGFSASSQDCEDAIANVWINLLADDNQVMRHCLERGNALQTMLVLARNRTIDIMRKHNSKVVALQDDQQLGVQLPEEIVEDGDEKRVLRAAIAELSERERMLIEMFFLQEKKYREIAMLTKIPQNSIGPTLSRALAKLRRILPRLQEERAAGIGERLKAATLT
jgi:RNA polymerase sigma-70 factor (ECF subfamily)